MTHYYHVGNGSNFFPGSVDDPEVRAENLDWLLGDGFTRAEIKDSVAYTLSTGHTTTGLGPCVLCQFGTCPKQVASQNMLDDQDASPQLLDQNKIGQAYNGASANNP